MTSRAKVRRLVYQALTGDPMTLDQIAESINMAATTEDLLEVRRALDDLTRTRRDVKAKFLDPHMGWLREP